MTIDRIPPTSDTPLPMSSGIIPTNDAKPLATVPSAVAPATFALAAASIKRLNGAKSDKERGTK